MDIKIPAPVPGEDYPRNWNEFFDWFATEEACLAYLERLRWPQGFVCSSCGSANQPYRSSRARLMCQECGHQSTVCAGTIFDKTRTPLRVWLSAAWYLTNQKQGVSALGLQRVLGLGSYQTAWTMLHRFRRAMVRQGRQRLKGQVEVDETYLALTDREEPISRVGRKNSTTKVLIIIAVERLQPKGFGRLRLRSIPKDSAAYVIPFVQAAIEPHSQVRTDGSAAYRSLSDLGYEHQRTVMLGSDLPAHVIHGWRSSGGFAGQALDSWNPSWIGPTGASGHLPRGVRVPLQSSHIGFSRYALLQVAPTGCDHSPCNLPPCGAKDVKASTTRVSLRDGSSLNLDLLELSGYPFQANTVTAAPPALKAK